MEDFSSDHVKCVITIGDKGELYFLRNVRKDVLFHNRGTFDYLRNSFQP